MDAVEPRVQGHRKKGRDAADNSRAMLRRRETGPCEGDFWMRTMLMLRCSNMAHCLHIHPKEIPMSHTHATTKAAACHDALEVFQEEHQHAPDAHEKARLLSDTVKEWEQEELAATHPSATAD
jgi:hypothetical protein